MIKITAKKQYGDRTVLNVNGLTFERGKAYALVGANGSGKSTLLKVIDSQLKADGEKNIPKFMTVGYMPQSSYAFSISVKRNILLPLKFYQRRNLRRRFDNLVETLELKGLLKKNAAKLSGGETQRMALARTLMVRADLLLLDEPTAAMDVEQAQAVLKLLKQEVREYHTTLIFATHSLKQAEELADEVLFMSNGVVVERGAPSDVLHNPLYNETKTFIGFNS